MAKARNPEGHMSVVTVRVPPALRDRMEYVYRNDVAMKSVSAVVVAAIEAFLPGVERKLSRERGRPV